MTKGSQTFRFDEVNLFCKKISDKLEIQLAYAIGVAEPVSIFVDTKGTGVKSDKEIAEIIRKEVDMTPKGIISRLDLKRPIYSKTVAYGHFGRNENEFTWEKLDLVDKFQKYL